MECSTWIRWLSSLDPAQPQPGPENLGLRDALQSLTRRLAFDPASWDDDDRRHVTEIFDERAPEFHTRGTAAYLAPLADALARGEVAKGGACLEIGSGVGLQTPALCGHFASVISMDLSMEMLTRAAHTQALLVMADATRLPVRDESIDAIVCVNAFLFAKEYYRVLAPCGCVVFVSTRGDKTPIYLAPEDLLDALEAVTGRSFCSVSGRAAEGIWSVVSRAEVTV